MLSGARRWAARSAAAVLLSLLAVFTGTAGARATDPPERCKHGDCGDTGDAAGPGVATSADGQTIAVEVWGTGVRDDGERVTPARRTVRVAPACFYEQFWTGQQYAASWNTAGQLQQLQGHLPQEDRFSAWPGYLDHKDDTEGHWWVPTCDMSRFSDAARSSSAYREFRTTHDVIYVAARGTPPRAAVVPPETLAQIAFDETDLPVGRLAWNPRHVGDEATFVGLDTWVWLEDPVLQVDATAAIPGLSATVTSKFVSMRVEADGADAVTCDATPGTPWIPGAGEGCTIVFTRSSANQRIKAGQVLPTATLTATSRWESSWTSTASPDTRPVAAPLTTTATAELPVAEIQTIVTS